MRPPLAPALLAHNPSKPTFGRFNENDYKNGVPSQPGSAIGRKVSNRLLGNREAFVNHTSKAVNQDGDSKLGGQTSMSNSTKEYSDYDQNVPTNIENPHANLELNEEELEEIYSRPYMNAEFARFGCDPHSNRILEAEKALIEAKSEKCLELIKQNGEIFRILEQAKTDRHVMSMTNGHELDLTQITNLLF